MMCWILLDLRAQNLDLLIIDVAHSVKSSKSFFRGSCNMSSSDVFYHEAGPWQLVLGLSVFQSLSLESVTWNHVGIPGCLLATVFPTFALHCRAHGTEDRYSAFVPYV